MVLSILYFLGGGGGGGGACVDVYLLCFAYVNRVSPSQTIIETVSVR